MFNFVTVSLPNSPAQPFRVFKLRYTQKHYEHDFARIYFRDWGVDPKRVKPGTLITVKLAGKEFAGYIHDIKGHKDNNRDFTEVSIIGASYVMRQSSQTIYKNITASEVVKKIAQKYGFSYKIEPHPRVYPQINQGGLTDWELMVKLAKQCGYFLKAESTSLYFQPLMLEAEERSEEALAFTKVDAGFKSGLPLYSFRPNVGETLYHATADKSATSVAGIDPKTGQYFKYTKPVRNTPTRAISQPELFDKHATTVVANDYSIAKSEAAAIDDNSQFPYRAEAEVLGTSSLTPGVSVYLANLGESYSGYWTVLSVEHNVHEESLNNQVFTTMLHLGADSLGEVVSAKYPKVPSSRPKRRISANQRSTRVKPKNVIKTPALKYKPVKTVKLVTRTNRRADSGQTVSQATWSSDQANLKSKQQKPGRSPIALRKVVSNLARQ